MVDELQLIKACQKGDQKAFARLIDQYRYPVFGLCLGYTRDFDDAHDATQEAFVSAYLNLKSLANPEFFGPWLKRIAINQCRTQWRYLKRWTPLDEAPQEAFIDPTPSVVAQMVRAEIQTEVMMAIERLPEAQRQVITLFYLEAMSLRRISAFLGISESSAKQRLYRARLNLKEEMLEMVKEAVGDYEFPPDFTRQVVDEALQRGQDLLDNRDWQGAQDVFRKVVDAIPDHVDANRGLGLALGNEVNAKSKTSVFDDGELAQDAFERLTRAYDLGATDGTVVRRLAHMYSKFGRNREGGQFVEKAAEVQADWKEKVALLKMALSIYYHSHYRNGEDNKADCVRCHKKARALLPDDLDVQLKFDVWVPTGMALAYPHVGLADEVFQEMDAISEEMGDRGSIWDYYYIALARSNTYRELGQWEEMIENNRAFVQWVSDLPEGDACFFRPQKTLREYESKYDRAGEWVRWHVMIYMLGEIVRAEHRLGRDTKKTFEATDRVLEQFEAWVEKSDEKTKTQMVSRWLSGGYSRTGESAFYLEDHERALAYYEKEEAIKGRLDMHGPIYRVGVLAALGRHHEAIQQLETLKGTLVTSGQWRTAFERHRAFDSIRNNPQVIAIMDRWKKAEEAGQI